MAQHNQTGTEGERIAKEFLESSGYTILKTNWRKGKAEVDIIAQQNGLIIFVEVKTRTSEAFGMPYEAVHSHKEDLLINAAEIFIEEINSDAEIRFDILSIVLNNKAPKIEHILDAFSGHS
jgi:putative endonuclease